MKLISRLFALVSISLICNFASAQTAPWWCPVPDGSTETVKHVEFLPKTNICIYRVQCPDGKCKTISLDHPQTTFSEKPLSISSVTLNEKSGAQFDQLPANVTECAPTTPTNLAIGDKHVVLKDGTRTDGPTSCMIKLVNVKTDSLANDDTLVTYQLGGGHRIDVKLIK